MADIRTFRDRVTLRFIGDVADVRLARPERMNALDGPMFDALADVLGTLATSQARAVVLSGEGTSFCTGLDKAMFAEILVGEVPRGIPADLRGRTHGCANLPQHVAVGWRFLAMPVIAALNGAVFGGGLQIALGADLRIVGPDARLALMEMRWGLVPDMGAFAILPLLVPDDVFRDLLFTAREFGCDEAMRLGLATRLADDPHDAAMELAQNIAKASPSAVRAAKRLANRAFDVMKDMLIKESDEQQLLIGGADQRAIITAVLARGRQETTHRGE
jgi:enoyl-CoA hydratase/carnithine racemase